MMGGVDFEEIRARGSIRDGDVLKLRRNFNEDGTISEREAEMLISLNQACRVKDASWAPFFIEALTDYVVHQAEPEGYVTAENAEWLTAHISRDGHVESHTELELLVNILDKSRWSPPSLSRFALEQVKFAVMTGDGPTRSGLALEPGSIGKAEVDLLRRILYAFTGDGGIAVTAAEADVLVDINDAIGPAKSSPAWTDLFVKAIGGSVLSGMGYQVPSREEALRTESWLQSDDQRAASSLLFDAVGMGGSSSESGSARSRVANFLGRMASPTGIWNSYREQTPEERSLARLERQRLEIITHEKVEAAEASWLISRLGRNGQLDGNEIALIEFILRETTSPHPDLAEFARQHGIAA